MSAHSGQKGNTEQEAEIGKDSLKVKIKLNKNNINKTDSSMEDISPIVDQHTLTEKPLKIKIRKNDLINSSPSVNNSTSTANSMELSNAKVLSLAVFPKLESISFPQLQRVSGVTPEQFSDWSDRDVNLLKEELENIKRNIKDFTTSLQNQLDSLESSKDKKESLIIKPLNPLPSTPLSNPIPLVNSNTNSLNSPISTTTTAASPVIKKDPLPIMTSTPLSSQVKSEPKRKYRKRKKHGEGSSDEDEQFEETQDSEIEDEIDVVNDIDIEDAEYIDAPLDNENNTKSGPRQGKIIRKRNTQGRNKKNAVGKNRQNKSNYIKKNKASSSSSQAKSDDNDSDELELNQLPRPPGKVPPKHNFWIDMEPYFTPFTEDDLKLLTHQTLDPEDSAFIIPPLGKPRADSILQQQQQQQQQSLAEEAMLEETSSVTTSVKSESKVEEDKGLHCGDLTSRVLAALIEEKIVPNSTSIPTLTSNSNSFSLKPSKENSFEDNSTSDTSCLPITTPPVYDFSQNSIVNLEERIKLELKAIGLLEEDINIDSNNREDDEICSELRLLQHQLREHVNISNRIRSKLYDAVKNAIDIQEKERKERIVEEALEQQYVKTQKKKKRKSTSVT